MPFKPDLVRGHWVNPRDTEREKDPALTVVGLIWPETAPKEPERDKDLKDRATGKEDSREKEKVAKDVLIAEDRIWPEIVPRAKEKGTEESGDSNRKWT